MTRTYRLWARLAVALALFALAASPALARSTAPGAAPTAWRAEHQAPPRLQAIRVVHVTAGGGFSWGDAAIGGAAVLALTMIAMGGALALSHDHRPSPGARH